MPVGRPLNSTLAFSWKRCKSMNVSITNSRKNTKKNCWKKIDEIFSIDAAEAEKKYKNICTAIRAIFEEE